MASEMRPQIGAWAAWFAVCALIGVASVFAGVSPARADEIRDAQWELEFLDIAKVHQITRGGGVTVAVVDTGVDGDHPDLKGSVLDGFDRTDLAGGNGWNDTHGHGTAMASLIAGHGHGPGHGDGILGIAPDAKILPCKIGDGEDARPDETAEAIRKAVELGADVINISLAYPAKGSEALRQAVAEALRRDVVVVAGAGNTSKGLLKVTAPANYPGVVAVAATEQDRGFSAASREGPEVVLAAPGEAITSADSTTGSGYARGTGTSNSTAIVSGVAALIRAKYPDLNAASVIQRLITTADDEGSQGRDNQYGYGIVNPLKALTTNVTPVKTNPLLPAATTATAKPEDSGTGVSVYAIVGLGAAAMATLLALGVWLIRRSSRPS